MGKNIIACRPGVYDLPLPEALKELKSAGIENAEVPVPSDGDFAKIAGAADAAGVGISTLSCNMTVDKPETAEMVEKAVDGAREIGVKIIFLSATSKGMSYDDGLPILKRLAAKAAGAGVVLSLETHVPYCHNGDVAKKTMELVDSPGVGHNFDTANVYFYNPRGTDAAEELKKVLPYVTSVHLKDSGKGEPESWDFPVLGTGVVDFPEIFRLLGERGFTGPYTMEIEGPLVDGLPTEERTAKVAACVEHLRNIGAMD